MVKQKKIIFDIGHPAQVHHFKNVYCDLEKKGWQCLFTAKEKEMSIYLLEKYGLKYEKIGLSKKSMVKKVMQYFPNALLFLKIVRRYKPDLIFSRYSPHAAHIAKILGIPHVGFTDTENVSLLDKITVPFVDVKLTADSYKKELGKNHLRYSGNIELAYLHPNRFIPDKSILKYLGMKKGEKYSILRFVAWEAYHDRNQSGFKLKDKFKLVEVLSKKLKVFISSEKELPVELKKYKINIPPEKMHDALSYADLYIGEGATMASECAMLGTPAIYVNSLEVGYCKEEEDKYKLVYNFRDSEGVLEKALELLKIKNLKQIHQERRQKMLADKIDVTAFMIWFVENYPESIKIMREDPDYQLGFK